MHEETEPIRGDSWHKIQEHRAWQVVFVWVVPLLAALFSATGGFLLKAFTIEQPYFWIGIFTPVAVAVLTILGQQYRQRRNDQATWLQRQTLTCFTDNLKAIHDPLIRLYKSKQTRQDAVHFLTDFTRGGSHLFAYDGLRVSVYALDTWYFDGSERADGEDDAHISGGYILKLIAFGGRSDYPRLVFTEDTPHGRRAIQIALQHVAYPVTHVDPDDSSINRPQSSIWKSFMAFPIRSMDQHLGVVMIDSRDEVKWTEQDHAIGSTISTLISDGVLTYKNGSEDAIPETRQLIDTLSIQGEQSSLYNVFTNPRIAQDTERSDSNGNDL